jgi:CheY-like chemotaxis protein
MPRILFVEDDADTREVISLMLLRAQYDLITASNGREALARIIEAPPDVLLLDLALPEMDGVALVRVLRSYLRWSSIPIVVLTAMSGSTLIEEIKRLNVATVLLKASANFDHILTAIRDALSRPAPKEKAADTEDWRPDERSPL